MLSGQLPRIPEPRGSDPDWFRQMKIWCTDVVRAIARSRLVADNATLREQNGVLSAIPDFPSMFKVDQTGPESISVRAGVASRYDGTEGTAATYEMTTVGAGTSASPLDGVELTSLAVSQWIILTLDESAGTLTATATGDDLTIPTGDDGTVIPVALVIVDGGKITRIFQAHSGPWYLPSPVKPDGLSLNRTAAGKLQLRNYQTATNNPDEFFASSSLIPYKGVMIEEGVAVTYITLLAALAKVDKPGWEGLELLLEVIDDVAKALKHSELKDIVEGLAGDDHGGTGNFSYLANSGSEGRNSMGENTGLGDGSGGMSVDVHGRKLSDGSFDAVKWLLRKLYNSAGVETFDWENGRGLDGANTAFDWLLRTLGNGDWSALANFGVTLRATVNDLTVTQDEVTVAGQTFTKQFILAVDPADGETYRYQVLARKDDLS